MKSTKKFDRYALKASVNQLVQNRWLTVVIIVTFLLAWEISADLDLIPKLFFPPPTVIAETFQDEIANGGLINRMALTLNRLFIGFFYGGTTGLVLGIMMGWSKTLRNALDPIIAALHPVPKITILPLILIIFGIGETSLILVIAISSFFPMLINSMAGVLAINPTLLEVVRNYRARPFSIFRRLIIPGSLPFILTGARLSLNRSLVLTVAIDMIFYDDGLGEMIWFAWQTMRTEELYVGIISISVIGVGLSALLKSLNVYLTPWNQDA